LAVGRGRKDFKAIVETPLFYTKAMELGKRRREDASLGAQAGRSTDVRKG
jgi:hypothetical protein